MTNQEKFNGFRLLDHPEVLQSLSRERFPNSLTEVFTPVMIRLFYITNRADCDMLYGLASRYRDRSRDVTRKAVKAFLRDLCLIMFAGVKWIQREGWTEFSWISPYSTTTSAADCVSRISHMEEMRRVRRLQAMRDVLVISESEDDASESEEDASESEEDEDASESG